jgi:hypothetical protein
MLGMKDFYSGRGGVSARQHLETARKLAETSTDPKVADLLPQIKSALTLFNELSDRTRGMPSFFSRFGFPFPGFGGGKAGAEPPPGPFFDYDDEYDEFDDEYDEFDDEYDDEDFEPSPSPSPSPPRRKSKKRKSRKKR